MKKLRLAAFILAATMAVSFASCGAGDSSDSDKETASKVSEESVEDTSGDEADTTENTSETDEKSDKNGSDKKNSDKKGSKSGSDLTALSESELRDYLSDKIAGVTNYRTDMSISMDMEMDMAKLLEANGTSVSELTEEDKQSLASMGIDISKPMKIAIDADMKVEATDKVLHSSEVTTNIGGTIFGTALDDNEEQKTETYIDLDSFDGTKYTAYTYEDGKWTSKDMTVAEKNENVSSSLVESKVAEKAQSIKAEKSGNGYKVTVEVSSDDLAEDNDSDDIFSELSGLTVSIIFTIEDDVITGIDIDADELMKQASSVMSESIASEIGGDAATDIVKLNKFEIGMKVYDIGKVDITIPAEAKANSPEFDD